MYLGYLTDSTTLANCTVGMYAIISLTGGEYTDGMGNIFEKGTQKWNSISYF
jgi:hypothetical protein